MTISSFCATVSVLLLIALCVFNKVDKKNRFYWYATGEYKYSPQLMRAIAWVIMVTAIVHAMLSIGYFIYLISKQ
jgi:hypothetical protein